MNIYEIEGYFIAAKTINSAFDEYMEQTNCLEDIALEEIDEAEETEYIIKIRKLTQKEKETRNIVCCEDGCELCEEKGEAVYLSLQQLMQKETEFPVLLAMEE